MQDKREFFTDLIIVLLICSAAVYVALHVRIDNNPSLAAEKNIPQSEETFFVPPEADPDYENAQTALGEFLCKDIYINGYHINNWELSQPFITVNDNIYVPASEPVLNALGISIVFDDAKHWVIFSEKEAAQGGISDGSNACNLKDTEVYTGHPYVLGEKDAPTNFAVTDNGPSGRRLYLSLNALRDYSGIDFSYYYDPVGGIYLSSLSDIPAREFFSEENKKYSEGRARYMMDVNPELSLETALYYEYLFRHEAAINPNCEEDLLIAICHTESWFINTARSNVDAIGLMQVMLIYAQQEGYTAEMLEEPHFNIQRGAEWLEMFTEYFNNDPDLGLAAYYMGSGAVSEQLRVYGTYNSEYADVCKNRRSMIRYFTEENGYGNTFSEYVGK